MILSLSQAISILDPAEKIEFAIAFGVHQPRFIWRATNISIVIDSGVAFGVLKA